MEPLEYYVEGFRRYAQFHGRARRKAFWLFRLVDLIIGLALATAETQLGLVTVDQLLTPSNVYAAVSFVPVIAVGVRRMHDVGKSGWYIIIPIYNIILWATPGVEGPNAYGEDPKAPEEVTLQDHFL